MRCGGFGLRLLLFWVFGLVVLVVCCFGFALYVFDLIFIWVYFGCWCFAVGGCFALVCFVCFVCLGFDAVVLFCFALFGCLF